MCYLTTDGRRIDNRVSDFMSRYPKGKTPHGARNTLRHPKPLEVFQDDQTVFGLLLGRDPSSDQYIFRVAGADKPTLIDGNTPAVKSTKDQVLSAAEAVTA